MIRARSESAEDEQQVRLAEKRMGRTPAELTGWFAAFAQENLGRLRPEEIEAKGYDLKALPGLVFRLIPAGSVGTVRNWAATVGAMPLKRFDQFNISSPNRLKQVVTSGALLLPKAEGRIYRSSGQGSPKTRFGILLNVGDTVEQAIFNAPGTACGPALSVDVGRSS